MCGTCVAGVRRRCLVDVGGAVVAVVGGFLSSAATFFEAIREAVVSSVTAGPVTRGGCGCKEVSRGVVGFAQTEDPLVSLPVLAHLGQRVEGLGLHHALCICCCVGSVERLCRILGTHWGLFLSSVACCCCIVLT